MTDKRYDVVVVGGGIAGLSAAWHLRGRDVLVLERSDRVGGRVRSELRDPYWLNLGAHVFGGPTTAGGRLIADVGVRSIPVPGRLAAVAMGDRLVTSRRVESYPFRLPLGANDRLALMRAGTRLRLAVARYNREAVPRPGDSPADVRRRLVDYLADQTFSEWLGDLPPRVDALFRATVARSAASPEQITAGQGIGYFALVWAKGSGLSSNIVGGSSMICEGIVAELGDRVWLESTAEEVVAHQHGVRVRWRSDSGRMGVVEAAHAVVATPAYETVRLVKGLPDLTRTALKGIRYGPYVVCAILTGESGPMPYDHVYALATPGRPFNMLFNMANLLRTNGDRRPGGSLMLYRGGPEAGALLERTDVEIVQEFLDSLHDLFPETRGIERETLLLRLPQALPYPYPGRQRLQEGLEADLGRVHLAGDYLGGWYSETAISSGEEVAKAIRSSTN